MRKLFNYLKSFFSSDMELEVEVEEVELKKEQVSLECDVSYSFELYDDYEETDCYSNRIYHLSVSYKASVHLNPDGVDTCELNGKAFFGNGYFSKYELYEEIFKIFKGDDAKLMETLNRNILYELERYMKENKTENFKSLLKENNSFDIKLSIDIDKDKVSPI